MKNSIDLKQCLHIYDKVVSEGEAVDGCYHLNGMKAWTDFDGYNCFLQYPDVTVTLMFHGKYDVQFSSTDSLNKFDKKLISLDLD